MTRECIHCRGYGRSGEVEERSWVEPDPMKGDLLFQGWICDECAIIHWATKVTENCTPSGRADDLGATNRLEIFGEL